MAGDVWRSRHLPGFHQLVPTHLILGV
jgi:hypothetical protein